MAKSVVVVSDLSGEGSARSHRLALDSVVYEIDLTDSEFADLKAAVSRFTQVARREAAGRISPSGRRGASSTRRNRSDVAAIKAWGRDNGWQVPERGRLSKALVAAYHAAVGDLADL